MRLKHKETRVLRDVKRPSNDSYGTVLGGNLQVRRVSPLEIDQMKSSDCHMPGKNTTHKDTLWS